MLEKYFEKNFLISIKGHADKFTIDKLLDDIIAALENITCDTDIINSNIQVFEVLQQDSTTYEKFE